MSQTPKNIKPCQPLHQQLKAWRERGEKRDALLNVLAAFVSSNPEHREEALVVASEFITLSTDQLSKHLDKRAVTEETSHQANAVLSSLASLPDASYGINELVCSSVASLISQSCYRTSSDFLSILTLLMGVTGSLVGGHLRVESGVKDGYLPLSLRILNVGDSSDGKSEGTNKTVSPLYKVYGDDNLRIKALVEAIEKQKTVKDENDQEVALTSDVKKQMKQEARRSRRQVIADFKSFSAEGLARTLSEQEEKAGVLLFRDEASDLLHHERYGARGSGNSSQTTGLLKSLVMSSQVEPLTGEISRSSSDNCGEFTNQTLSIIGNVQLHFLPDLIPLSEDSHGWGARWLLVRANRFSRPTAIRTLKGDDPLTGYIQQRLIPFGLGIKPVKTDRTSVKGVPIDFISLRFSEDDGAQFAYNAFYDAQISYLSMCNESGSVTEAAYNTWLSKGSIRVAQFAAILHLLEMCEGAQMKTCVPNPLSEVGVDVTFDSNKRFFDRKGNLIPISKANVERAIRLEQMLQHEYLEISDAANISVLDKQAHHTSNEVKQSMLWILSRLELKGSVIESQFVSSLKGGAKKLSPQEIRTFIQELTNTGCIRRWKDGKTYLEYLKPMRT